LRRRLRPLVVWNATKSSVAAAFRAAPTIAPVRTTAEIREGFLSFHEAKGHLRRPSASLIPRADDRSTLLVSAGMQRDEAYRIVQRAAQQAWDTETPLRSILAAEPAVAGLDLDAIFDYDHYVRHVPEVLRRLEAIG